MPRPSRFSEIAPLPPHGAWRRVLAVDGGALPARRVALSFVPQAVLDDPARLAAVARDVEIAGRLHHPTAVAVLGLEEVGDAPAVVEAHAPGQSLRSLLDAGGRLPPDLAARIALDVCAAVARAHALDAGDGHGLVHGAIAPSRIVLGEDGTARLAGFAAAGAGGTDPGVDVRAIAAALHECLAGEPPSEPPRPLDAPGVPAALAAAVDLGTGAARDAEPPSAAALAQRIAAAGAVASHAEVAAYLEAILPRGEGAAREATLAATGEVALEVSAELIVDPAEAARACVPAAPTPPPASAPALARPGAEPTPEPLPRPPATRPGADPVGTFAAPPRPAPRSRAPLATALVCLALGFAGGFAGARRTGLALSFAGARPPDSLETAEPRREPSTTAVAPASAGASAGRREAAPPVPAAAPPAAAAKPKPSRPPRTPARPSRAAAAPQVQGGFLDVRAPADAEVFLDGRRIGRGGLRRDVPAGAHRIEVRLGEARIGERFEVLPGETWTYDVTPTQ